MNLIVSGWKLRVYEGRSWNFYLKQIDDLIYFEHWLKYLKSNPDTPDIIGYHLALNMGSFNQRVASWYWHCLYLHTEGNKVKKPWKEIKR